MNTSNIGLRQQIARAKSATEIDGLLRQVSLALFMSPKTRRACGYTAVRRKKELERAPVATKAAPVAPQKAEGLNSKDRRASRRAALKGAK